MDLIDRQAAIDAVMEFMPSLTTPDGSGQFDAEIHAAQEMFVDIGQALSDLPSAQSNTSNTSNALDCVDRQAALACFQGWVDWYGDTHTPDEMPEYQRIEALPSVEPERKKGKWIFIESVYKHDGWDADIYRCNQCHRRTELRVVLKSGEDITDYKRYCGFCGADMRGEQDE